MKYSVQINNNNNNDNNNNNNYNNNYKKAGKRRAALSLQENEGHEETVGTFPCIYDKWKKEYKDKIVVQNASKEAADQLDFIENITS